MHKVRHFRTEKFHRNHIEILYESVQFHRKYVGNRKNPVCQTKVIRQLALTSELAAGAVPVADRDLEFFKKKT
jgi:hypothetical protein